MNHYDNNGNSGTYLLESVNYMIITTHLRLEYFTHFTIFYMILYNLKSKRKIMYCIMNDIMDV